METVDLKKENVLLSGASSHDSLFGGQIPAFVMD